GRIARWSRDGKVICLLAGDEVLRIDPVKGTEVRRWSVAETGTPFWASGKPILTGIGTLAPRLWDNTTGKLLHTLKGHTAGVSAHAFSPGGKILATGGYDKTVRVWSPASGKMLRTLTVSGVVTALSIAGDGKIAVGTDDKKVTVFASDATKPLRTWSEHSAPV